MIIIMAVVMVAMLAFGGTYAYFTATATGLETSKVYTANVELLSDGTASGLVIETNSNILPGEKAFTTDAIVKLTHKSTVATYVFATIATDNNLVINGDTGVENVFELDLAYDEDETSGWVKVADGVYGIAVNAVNHTHPADGEDTIAAEAVENFVFNVKFNDEVTSTKAQGVETSNVYAKGDATQAKVAIMHTSVKVSLSFSAIPQSNFAEEASPMVAAWEALNPQQ